MNHVPPNVTNIAMDEAQVDAQIGYVNGNVTIYSVTPDDHPQRKYETGLAYLRGDNPRQAEKLIEEAVMSDYRSNEVAYYWTLAIMSDRSFDHLGQDEFRRLHTAITITRQFPPDPWRDAFDVVISLIECVDEETNGPSDPERLSATLDRFRKLPQERKDEIHRHLDMVMHGWIQDRISNLQAEHVREMRFHGNREQRVWKFFEPEPTEPRPITPVKPVLGGVKMVKVLFGCLVGGLGLLLMIAALALHAPFALLLILALAGVWVLTTVKVALPLRRTKEQPTQWRNAVFARAVSSSVDHWFREEGPDDQMGASEWARQSEPMRAKLKEELVLLYGGDHTRVGPIRWLIRWHARNAAQRFFAGESPRPADSATSTPVMVGNIALGAAILIAFVDTVALGLGMIFAWIMLGVGVRYAWSDGLDHLAATRRFNDERAEADRRYAAERQEYERWCAVLADRPSDIEMAMWLDYDKMTIRSWALKEYGLSNRDVLAHLTLTEAAPNCRRARVLYGPPRYSAYIVLLFLLTEGGVRQITVTLDFATGTFHNQQRDNFRYEMIASARVEEVGVRFEHGRRRVLARREIGPHDHEALIMRRAFRLSLVNNQHVDVLVDGFEEAMFGRPPEESDYLAALALDTSGVSAALRILEAVSAEGREWLQHERARRRRRLHDFRESRRIPDAIDFLRRPLSLPEATGEQPAQEG